VQCTQTRALGFAQAQNPNKVQPRLMASREACEYLARLSWQKPSLGSALPAEPAALGTETLGNHATSLA